MALHNRINREVLKERIAKQNDPRFTVSFYNYYHLQNVPLVRDYLYHEFEKLEVLGRIYVANEGINAQASVPRRRWDEFIHFMESIAFLKGLRLNKAVEHSDRSFFKLAVKIKAKIVADGLNDETFDVTNKGIHLNAEAFNKLTDNPETILVDMRNHYETEIGHFEGAWCPDVDTFREQLPLVVESLKDKKDKPIVMYCTGGIRCEKASAWLKHNGFEKVYQLEGGIIKYANDAKVQGLPIKFRGKNFVFDERLGERISGEVIAHCHQCGKPADVHHNCKNVACNLLFIQCEECKEIMDGCCSPKCQEIIQLPEEVQKELRKGKDTGVRIFSKGRFRTISQS